MSVRNGYQSERSALKHQNLKLRIAVVLLFFISATEAAATFYLTRHENFAQLKQQNKDQQEQITQLKEEMNQNQTAFHVGEDQ